jgi:hypothetical protein
MQTIPQGYVEVNLAFFQTYCRKYIALMQKEKEEYLQEQYAIFQQDVADGLNMSIWQKFRYDPKYHKSIDDSYDSFQKYAYNWSGGRILHEAEYHFQTKVEVAKMLTDNAIGDCNKSIVITLEEHNKIVKTVEDSRLSLYNK